MKCAINLLLKCLIYDPHMLNTKARKNDNMKNAEDHQKQQMKISNKDTHCEANCFKSKH